MAALFYLEYKFISQLFTVLRLLQLSLSAGPGRHQHKSKSSAWWRFAWCDQILEILIPLSDSLTLIMGDWSLSQVSLLGSDCHLIVMWYSDTLIPAQHVHRGLPLIRERCSEHIGNISDSKVHQFLLLSTSFTFFFLEFPSFEDLLWCDCEYHYQVMFFW